jgi:hypothetical protein
MMRRLYFIGSALLVALSLVLPAAAQSGTARVRIAHAAPDMGPVDILVDGDIVLSNVEFPAISDYLAMPAGSHRVAVAPTGQDVSAALITAESTFKAGSAYTAAAVGLADVSVAIYTDDLSALPPGKARVRFIHTSPDAPSADIEVVDGPTLFQNISFGEASEYQLVDAGPYNLIAAAAGANIVIVPLPNTTFEAGTIYDVIAVGRLANVQVAVGTFTPAANPSAEADGAAPAPSRSMMPNTGANTPVHALLVLGMSLVVAGLLAGRRWGHKPAQTRERPDEIGDPCSKHPSHDRA